MLWNGLELPSNPYFHDNQIVIYCSDFREILHQIPYKTIGGIVTDPPYGENMGYAGDNGFHEARNLLDDLIRGVATLLQDRKHLALFWTMRNLDQAIDAVRSHGLTYRRTLTMYLPKGSARPYLGWLPRTQPIIIAQKYLPAQPPEFHTRLAEHVHQRMLHQELTCSTVAKSLGCDSRLVMKWSRVGDPAWCLPTARFYPQLKKMLSLDNEWDILLDRQAESRNGRKYNYKHDMYIVNDTLKEKTAHPSSKPLSVVTHIVDTITCPNDILLDPCLGTGTTAVASKQLNRKYIGIEISEEYCELSTIRYLRSLND